MKNHRRQMRIWLAALGTALLAAGCGAQTPTEAAKVTTTPGEPVAVVDSTPSATEASDTNAVPETAAAPVVRRSERALPPLRPEILEVVQLVDSGAGEEVVRAFVGVSPAAYQLTLEEIIYLRDIGVPDSVVAAMMRRGGEVRNDSETAQMQTNLVNAVGDLRQAIADRNAGAGAPPESAPVDPATANATPPGPAQAATASAPPADAPQAVQQFYTDLSPYGTWYQTPTYGWVWQPTVVVVDSGWRPYSHAGRWLWTDRGWYWCSDYSWGWAPFHYGRWAVYPSIGWCWVPDTVWGPSWVTWRHYDSYVGWAPLPPHCGWSSGVGLTWYGSGISIGFGFGLAHHHYCFVPKRDFCHRNVAAVAIRGERGTTIYNNSTVVNNVIVGNNNTIVNNGIGYNNVATHVRGEVPKARVEPLPGDASRPVRVDRPERSGDGMVVYKPAPVATEGGRPAAIRPEVRPASTRGDSLASVTPGLPTMRTGGGERGGASSGFVSTPSAAGNPMNSSRPQYNQAGAVGARPTVPMARTGTPSQQPAGVRSPATQVTPKPVESRGGRLTESVASPSQPLTPQRQTLPVPLADPSRNIPSSRSARTVSPTSPTAPTANSESAYSSSPRANERSGYTPSTAPTTVRPAPVTPQINRPSYNTPTPQVAPNRPVYNTPQSAPSRPSFNTPQAAPSRPSYSAPQQSYSVPQAPRQSFSAPTPSVSAPRPSFSAPSPSVSAPRPSVSAPSAAGATPSPSTRSGGPRAQSN